MYICTYDYTVDQMMEKEGVMGCVVCMGEFWLGFLKERDHMEDLDILEHNIEMGHEDTRMGVHGVD